MFLEQDAVLGLSRFVAKYEAYVREMKAQKKEPVTMLAYLVEMVQLTKRRFIAAAFRHWSFFLFFFSHSFGNNKTQMEC